MLDSDDNSPEGGVEEEPGFPDRRLIDLSRDPTPGVPDHLAPDDVGERPLIDMSRDPTSGVGNHRAPDDE
ncbi:MAG: hypothetical protein HYR62_10010 [Actinobacteria bacterium]|nr:hypothetical protein [Actinomycetota bacterium]MBI3686417.1 hypothetical protein [Actinomycetota bacterium]